MATYTPVPRNVPSSQRSALITAIANGDQVDVEDVLGRPARGIKFVMTDATDSITYRLNNLQRLIRFKENEADETVLVWAQGDSFSQYTDTGSVEHITQDSIKISSFQIDGLTLSTGTTITAVVW